jgi:hypothetical protein
MPRKRVAGRTRIAYGNGHIAHLRTGHDFFKTGFGDSPDLSEMKHAWLELKEQVLEADRRRWGLYHRPWAWWEFEEKTEEPDHKEQRTYLTENGLLDTVERKLLS